MKCNISFISFMYDILIWVEIITLFDTSKNKFERKSNNIVFYRTYHNAAHEHDEKPFYCSSSSNNPCHTNK